MLSCYPFSFKTCFISAFSLAKSSLLVIMETASTTIFSKSCNFMKSSKIVSKYHLSIKFLCSKKTVFSISDKLKTRGFQESLNMVFHANKNIILHHLCGSKKDRIPHLQKVQNKNFSVLIKHGIPC